MNPIAQYPVFEENQVLTAKNLNDVVAFLNDQDLASRRNLHGIGIVCGMKLSSDLSSKVVIGKGCGVTSLGHLITVPDMTLTYYRKYTDPVSPPYDKFLKTKDEQYPLWELFTEEEFTLAREPDNIKKLSTGAAPDLQDKAVIIYLEIFDRDPDSCIAEDCDQLATARLFNLRKLLINKDDLLAIINKSLHGKDVLSYMTAWDLFGKVNPQCKLPALVNHRLNKNLSDLTSLNLGQINSWDKLRDTYQNVIEADVIKISKALYISYDAYKAELKDQYQFVNPFEGFDNGDIHSNPLFDLILTEVKREDDMLNIQYAYDFLHDLSKAYTEFSDVANEYTGKCCPDPNQFPLHLMLGLLDKSNPQEDLTFRHKWQPSPASSDMKDLLEELRMLHFKMHVMVQDFRLRTFSKLQYIRVTPGKFTSSPFSKHTVAHYYMQNKDKEELVTSFWNYRLKKQCKEDTVLSYFPELYSNKQFVRDPLLFSLRDYNYFRIEGHIGQEYKSVLNTIEGQIRDFNLPFDILGVKLAGDHLDVEIDDHCFEDIQTSYKINRDEYLACLLAIYTPIKNFLDAFAAMDEKKKKALLATPIPEGMGMNFINTVGDLYLFLQVTAFIFKLCIEQLPEHVKDFKLPAFQAANFKVGAFALIMSIIFEYLSNLAKQLPMFMGLFIIRTFFDRLIDDCTSAKFKSIYELYQERLIKTQMGRLFPGYVTGSPGMEHIAGVKEGGTFILVYDEMPDAEPIRPQGPGPGKIPLDPCFEDERAQAMQLYVMQQAYIMRAAPDFYQQFEFMLDPDEEVKEEGGGETRGNENSGNESHFKKKILFEMPQNHMEIQAQKLPPRYQTTVGLLSTLFPGYDKVEEEEQIVYRVVADFAIPYRCCKSCLKAVKPEDPPPPDLSIRMEDDKEKFCWYKEEAYTVHVSPAVKEGVLVSSAGGVEQGGDGSWHFFPNKTDWTQQEVKLTYTVGEESVDKIIIVFKPIAKIKHKIDEEKQLLILENHSKNAESYTLIIPELDITKDWPPENGDFPIPLREIKPRVINPVIIAKIGDCEHSDTEEIFIREGGSAASIDIAKVKGRTDYKYLYSDKNDYRFFLAPPGEKPSGPEEAIIQKNDFYVFRPGNLSIGKYTFNYQKTATIDVEIVRGYQSIIDIGFRPIENVRPAGIGNYLNNAGYKEDEMIANYTVNLGEEINNKAKAKKEFLEGKKTSEIGTKYKEAMDETVVHIKKAYEAGETEAANYLMNTYIGMLDGVINTTEALGGNVKKSHGIYKRMEEAEENLRSLKAIGVNIDPDKKLKKLIKDTEASSLEAEMKIPIVKLNKILK